MALKTSGQSLYWPNVCISVAQIFFGIAAATTFVGPFALGKVLVVILTSMLSIIFWITGWRLVK